jgi:hypothetical protein
VEFWNLDEVVSPILSGVDEIEVRERKELEALHILGNASN